MSEIVLDLVLDFVLVRVWVNELGFLMAFLLGYAKEEVSILLLVNMSVPLFGLLMMPTFLTCYQIGHIALVV
jgi:hypothetical protein